MAIVSEMRARARHVVGPALGICAVAYFAFHAVHGERGFLAWQQLKQEMAAAEAMAEEVSTHRDAWERRVGRLRPESLDSDLLDEQARRMLGVAAATETVILTGKP